MGADDALHDPRTMLTATNVPHGVVLSLDKMDLGGLCRVSTMRICTDAVLYGEFQVDAAVLRDHDPGELQFDEAALRGVVEDWRALDDDMVTLGAYVYVEAHGHGPLGLTLGEAIEELNNIRVQCLSWLSFDPGTRSG